MTSFQSQAGQDQFIFKLIVNPEKLNNGTFIDIGANAPKEWNNTWCLEKIGWRGVGFDTNPVWVDKWKALRKSPYIMEDCTHSDYAAHLKNNGLPLLVDYLSLDVDSASLDTLKKLLSDKVRFRVATIEHDSYQFGNVPRDSMRELLMAEGYTLLCEDICNPVPFEDWWVNKSLIDWKVAEKMLMKNIQFWEVLK